MLFVKWCQVLVVCDTVHSSRYQITKEKMTINEIEILVDHYIPSVWLMTRWRHHWYQQLMLLVLALRRLLLLLTCCLHHHQCSFSAAAAAAALMPYRSSSSSFFECLINVFFLRMLELDCQMVGVLSYICALNCQSIRA